MFRTIPKHFSFPRSRSQQLCLVFLLLLVPGCANPSHLFFYQTTVFGLDVAVSPETKTVKVVAGYDRQTEAVIPTSQIVTSTGQTRNQALSVVGRTKIEAGWFGPQKITDNFATGTAAQNVATNPEAIADLLNANKDPK